MFKSLKISSLFLEPTKAKEQRTMKATPNINTTFKKRPQMLLITNSHPTHYKNPSKIIICLHQLGQDQSYCHFHIKIFYNMTHSSKEMVGILAKLELLEQLMFGHPQVEWIWWMDKTPCSQIYCSAYNSRSTKHTCMLVNVKEDKYMMNMKNTKTNQSNKLKQTSTSNKQTNIKQTHKHKK